ncbi:MAG: alpha/beta hydrolase, partial [Pseudomonadota bacterium]|nr:alpha/beta hydrolase [Pseudomonadota bacterium]
FAGIVMTAPMLGFSTAPWPFFLVPPFLSLINALGCSQHYVIGGSSFQPEPFSDDNTLTSDRDNYTRNQQLMIDFPQIQLGSPTNAWVSRSLVAIKEILAGAESLRLPLFILQAEIDQVVNNQVHECFCRRAGNCEMMVIAKARHEILMESPEIREMAGKAILDFFARVCDN